ncbi:hypothetical protein R1sor_025889 [Riccia sorocarpa]|uniref:Chorein N-terminal domain-containing protein n=1 Tax=Riccia sorocarpa TaxID=122646 RepID=A0ABD3GDJ5_9MARC
MFEGVLSQLLAGYLGHYVKGIQREQFRIGLWSGEAQLENVELRLEAFDYLQLPFSIKQGTVGKLKFQVPWQKLGWEPILISLEDVNLLAGPHEDSEWDGEASERRAVAAKKAALAAAEIAKLSQRVSEDKSGETFLSYLSAKIIDNVQVTVSKVHLRYVDGETDPEAVFSFGVTLSSLAITTTDGRDHPALPSMSVNAGKGAGSKVHKLVDLQRLAVYWNTESSSMLSPGNSDTSNEPGSTGPTVSDPENAKIYLLQPTNAKLRLTVDKNASVKGGGPHYSVAIDVDNLFVSLAEGQLQQMLMLAEALSVSQLRERYARFRPSMSRPFSENTGWQRRLWQFAIQAVVSDVRRYRRKLKGNFGLFNSRRQHYVLLYKEKLEALQRVQPAKDTRFAELEEMELELEMDEILFFRSVAENELLGSASGQDVFENAAGEPETTNGRAESREDDGALQAVPQSQRPFSQQRGWLNWLSLGLLGAAESIDAAVFPDQIIKDLCEAADFNPTSVIESGYHTKGWCRLILSVRVGEAVGILRNYETEIVSITLQRASVTSISWLDSTSVSILVPSLELVDLCTSGSEFPRILAPKARQPIRRSYSLAVQQNLGEVGVSNALVQSSSDSKLEAMKDEPGTSSAGYVEQNEHVVEVKITTGSQEFGIFISVSVQPVEFVYSSTFIQQAVDFLSQPAPYEKREELVTSCLDKIVISAGESSSRTGSTHPSKKRIRWTISVQKPTFLFPENNTVKDGVLMVFAWDSLEITSTELQSAMSTVSDIERNQRFGRGSDSSEQFEVQLTGIQVIIVSKYSNWQNKLSHDADQQSHLLERCNLHMGIRCVPSPSTRTIRLKISGEVTTLHTHLSLWKCVALKAVVAQIMSFRNRTEIEQATSSPTISRFVESSEGEQGNQLITSNDLGPAFELNLCFKAVTANLRVDGESGSSEVQETVLVAKMHDANVRFSRWNSQKEVIAFMVNKFHVEDANEVAGSSSRDLLCPSKDFAPSPTSARKDLITAEEAKFGSPRTSSSIKNAFAARISRSVVAGRSISAVNFHLQGMECHCHPKVMRALYWFVTAVTEAKPVDTNAGEEDDGSYSVNEGEQVSSEEVRRPFLEAGSATEDELADGSDTPMVLEFRDLVVHLYDPGGIIASLEFGDASVSIFSPKADHGSLKVVVSARGLKIKGPVWASGNCRGEVFGSCSNGPLATLNVSVIKNRRTRSPSGLTYKLTEVNTSLHNVQCILNSDYLALLIGYCVSSEWAFSINHDNLRNIGATGYSCTVGTHRSVVIWTVEISNSMVLLPRESDSIEFIELLIPRVFVSFTPSELTVPQSGSSGREPSAEDSPSTMDVVYVSCQELAITVRGLFQSAETIDTSGLTLIERADGEIIVELPVLDKASRDLETSPPIPINSQLDITVLVSNLAGSATGRSIDLLKEGEKELSSVSWKYKLYAKGGTSHWIRDHSPFRNLTPPVAPESPFSMRLSISQLTLFIKETYEASMDVAKLVADNLHLSCLISRGDLETLILEVLSIDMFEGLSLRPMLHVSTADDGGEDRKLFPLITYSSPELHLTLPNIRLWMHISAWVSVISATASCLTSSSEQPQDVEPPEEQRFQSGVPPLSASEASSSRVGLLQRRSDESIKDGADVAAFLKPGCNGSLTESSLRLSVGATRITCIVPDFLENVSMGPVPRTTLARRKLVRIVSWTGVTTDTDEPLGEDEMQETKNMDGVNESGKQILLSSTICINELELRRDKMWKLSASITQTEAVVEEVFLEKHKFRMALMQVKDVEIEGRINVPGTPWTSMAFSVVVKSVDVWCSYANLHFLSNFCFEPLKSQSSSATDTHCSLDLRLHNCSILLSDSRRREGARKEGGRQCAGREGADWLPPTSGGSRLAPSFEGVSRLPLTRESLTPTWREPMALS